MENKQQTNNSTARTVLMAAFSLLCALLLWVYVTETRGEDITRPFPGVPVVFEGASTMRDSRELIVSETGSTSVRVTLTGNRRTLSSLEDTDLCAVIDLNTITTTGNYSRAPKITFPSWTDTNAISATVTTPDTVNFYVDKLERKQLEIEGVFHGSVAEGFIAEPLEFNPGNVIIYGPEKILTQVKKAYVEVNRTELDRTLTFDSTYVLLDEDGNIFESDEITFGADTVSVTLPIRAVKDVSLTVDLIYGGGVSENNVKKNLEPDFITLTGDSDILAGLNNITLDRIDLSQVDESLTETYRITIPNDTEIISGSREAVLTLQIGGLYKRTFVIEKSNISCINVSEGYTWDIGNDSLEVTVRGPEAAVNALSPLNIRAVADLREYGNTTASVNVPVRIDIAGSTEVGALGEYKVVVNIKEETEGES